MSVCLSASLEQIHAVRPCVRMPHAYMLSHARNKQAFFVTHTKPALVSCVALGPVFFISHGYYRDAWLLPNSNDDTATPNADGEDFVLKQMRLPEDDDDTDHSPNAKSFSKIQREAVIMEQLTSSPRIVSTFGHCALSVLSETMPFEVSALIVPNSGHARQSEMNRLPTVQSRNNFTIQQIFDMTLESTCDCSLYGKIGF